MTIRFRPHTPADIPLVHRWLNETPEVFDLYAHGQPTPFEQVALKYGAPSEDGKTTRYLISYGETPIGSIQTYLWRSYPGILEYRWRDRPTETQRLTHLEESAGLDLFIGEPAFRHRGLGAQVLRAFLRQIVFADPAVQSCIIVPEERNTSALRAYAKVGFVNLGVLLDADEPGPVCLLRVGRHEVLG